MKWFSDLINPDATHADTQDWLQIVAFFVAVLFGGVGCWLVLQGSIKGKDAVDLLTWLVIIFLACTGLLGGSKVIQRAVVEREKVKASISPPKTPPKPSKPADAPKPAPEKQPA